MIKSVREIRILAALHERKALSVHELCALLDDAPAVTVRRDLARLARRGALVRTHGGAVWPAAPTDAAGAAGELIDLPAPNGPGLPDNSRTCFRLAAGSRQGPRNRRYRSASEPAAAEPGPGPRDRRAAFHRH